MGRFGLSKYNSISENDLLLYDAVRDGDFDRLLELLKDGYSITPFILNALVAYGKESHIKQVVKEASHFDREVVEWLCSYWEHDKAMDFLCEFHEDKFLHYATVDDLVDHKRWKELADREQYDVLLDAGQYELLYKRVSYLLKSVYLSASKNIYNSQGFMNYVFQKQDKITLLGMLSSDKIKQDNAVYCARLFLSLYAQDTEHKHYLVHWRKTDDKVMQVFLESEQWQLIQDFCNGNAIWAWYMLSHGATEHLNLNEWDRSVFRAVLPKLVKAKEWWLLTQYEKLVKKHSWRIWLKVKYHQIGF